MPNFVSPGVYVIEKDLSDYPVSINSSVVGIVGFAGRGPIAGKNNQKATLITSPAQLIDTFGEPNEGIVGQALEGALEILETTDSIRFIRCTSGAAIEASAAVPMGGCPAVLVSGTQSNPIMPEGVTVGTANVGMSAIGSNDPTSSGVRFTITTYDNARTKIVDAKTYTIPSGTITLTAAEGATSILGLQKIMGGALDADKIGAYADANTLDASSFIVGQAAGQAATMTITSELQDNAGLWQGYNILEAVNGMGSKVDVPLADAGSYAGSSYTASGVSVDATSVSYLAQSLYPGAGYKRRVRR